MTTIMIRSLRILVTTFVFVVVVSFAATPQEMPKTTLANRRSG